MRILIVTHYFATHRGGIEIVAGEVARRLARTYAVSWAASDCDPTPAIEGITYLPMPTNNVVERTFGLPLPIWSLRSYAQLFRLVRDADVVHLHDFAYPGNWVAFLAAKRFRKPMLVTQHIGSVPYRSRILRLAQWLAHATLGRLILGGADCVTFVSSVVRDYYTGFVHFRKPPTVIANGVDTDTFVDGDVDAQPRARATLDLDPEAPVFLFVGRFVEKKGLHIIEALARRLGDVTWILAGWGPIDPHSWGLPNVRVISDRRGAALVPLYQAADLLVLPSVGEGLPLVVQEAMSCGTPVITGEDTAASVGAPSDLVISCAVDGADAVDRCESALRSALADRVGLAAVRKRTATHARSRWTWMGCAAAYGTIFESLHNGSTQASTNFGAGH